MQQFNKLIEFRQHIYETGLVHQRDAQFELLDALLLQPRIHSYPELSLCPVFRRQWPSVYQAVAAGSQATTWLEGYLSRQVPQAAITYFALDGTAWVHAAAPTLADRQYVYSPTPAVDGGSIVVGHPYSVLAWVPERHSSWALPVSVHRIASTQTAVEVGVEQVKSLCAQWGAEQRPGLVVILADGKYGNHRFLGPLQETACGKLARMRKDRVLYRAPGEYGGRGRRRKHGDRFAFKDPDTWGMAAASAELEDAQWGQVRVRRWDNLHARQDATTVFSVLLVETHRERECPRAPLWLVYQPPANQDAVAPKLEELWRAYQYRWPIEPSIRFRKQALHWTLPRFQQVDRCDRWTMLVSLAQWQLFLARELVQDQPLPWQKQQRQLTPERVLQSLAGLFQQLGSPAAAPQKRGKSPGWPQGKPRTRPKRYRVVKKT